MLIVVFSGFVPALAVPLRYRLSGNRTQPLYRLIFILILLDPVTKSAQLPFHFWLPNAMAAPTPVSTYLHSATRRHRKDDRRPGESLSRPRPRGR